MEYNQTEVGEHYRPFTYGRTSHLWNIPKNNWLVAGYKLGPDRVIGLLDCQWYGANPKWWSTFRSFGEPDIVLLNGSPRSGVYCRMLINPGSQIHLHFDLDAKPGLEEALNRTPHNPKPIFRFGYDRINGLW